MSNPRVEFDDATRWARRFRRAVIALLIGAVLAVVTPLLADPGHRAGVVRRVRMAKMRAVSLPPATARLDVPFFKQERALSCEAATLRMVLAYRGVTISEAELLAAVGFDPTLHQRGNKNVPGTIRKGPWDIFVWGDPDEAFVGDVDGIMSKTGYGVHAGPIARVAGQYRNVEVITGGTPAALAAAIGHGNPVIMWGFIPGRGRPLAWRTLGGKEVRAVDGEHTRVVIGYTGTAEQPAGFFLLDPIYGEQYWPTEKFLRNWEPLGRTGVVVY